jgi:hypothetical protein
MAPATLSQLSNQLNNEAQTLATRLAQLEECIGEFAKDVAGIDRHLGGLAKDTTSQSEHCTTCCSLQMLLPISRYIYFVYFTRLLLLLIFSFSRLHFALADRTGCCVEV